MIIPASAQQLLPPYQVEVADDERLPWTLSKFPAQPFMREIYWSHSPDVHPFFRDSLLQAVARTYYYNRENFNGTRSQAWAGGGWLAWRSGLIGNVFGVHIAGYTSQPLFAPANEGGSRLLTPDQDAINVLGQVYGRIQIIDQEIRGGRQLIDTPLINPDDSRMVPNTFEAAQIVSLPDKDRFYDYAAGYIWNVKQRDSNDFISMSDAIANTNTVNHGAAFAMVRVRPVPGLSITAMDYHIDDFVNTGFAQVEYDFRQPKTMPNWIVGANVITQASVGSELLNGRDFQTYQASGKVQMSYAGWTVFGVGSVTGPESNIFSQYATKPNYTHMAQVSFDNANEKAVGGSISYDFGIPGLNIGAFYVHGWDAINPVNNAAIANRDELDVWIQYRPSEGPLKGLRFRTQYSNVWQKGNVRDDQPEFRFIVDYTVLFRPPPVVTPVVFRK